MPIILADGAASSVDVSTIGNVLTFLGSILTTIMTMLGNIYDTIVSTPLLFIAVVVSFTGAVIFFAIGILRRLGVGGGGRRRLRRGRR